jgi:hypothetical protein
MEASLSICNRLGGLPLAITQMSPIIRENQLTFKDFEDWYEEDAVRCYRGCLGRIRLAIRLHGFPLRNVSRHIYATLRKSSALTLAVAGSGEQRRAATFIAATHGQYSPMRSGYRLAHNQDHFRYISERGDPAQQVQAGIQHFGLWLLDNLQEKDWTDFIRYWSR